MSSLQIRLHHKDFKGDGGGMKGKLKDILTVLMAFGVLLFGAISFILVVVLFNPLTWVGITLIIIAWIIFK